MTIGAIFLTSQPASLLGAAFEASPHRQTALYLVVTALWFNAVDFELTTRVLILLLRASLVVRRLRICLPMEGTRVRALVREDPTCRGTTRPMSHNYWACALKPASHNYWACKPKLLSLRVWSLCSATREAAIVRGPRTTMKSGPRLPQLEKALAQKRRPNTAKNK